MLKYRLKNRLKYMLKYRLKNKLKDKFNSKFQFKLNFKISFILLFLIFILSGCSNTETNKINSYHNSTGKIQILTTFFPNFEITKAITKNTNSKVLVLINPGIDPHDFDLSIKKQIEVSNSNSFVIMNGIFTQTENKIINSNKNIKIINSTLNINSQFLEEKGKKRIDPHFWLSIDNMLIMSLNIKNQLSKLYPENSKFYEKNYNNYILKLNSLKLNYTSGLKNCNKNTILVNHEAFGYIMKEFGFKQVGISGFSNQDTINPNSIKSLIDTSKKLNLKYIFSEEQLDKKVVETIAKDANLKVLNLEPITLNKKENYFSIMNNNLKNFEIGLSCNSN